MVDFIFFSPIQSKPFRPQNLESTTSRLHQFLANTDVFSVVLLVPCRRTELKKKKCCSSTLPGPLAASRGSKRSSPLGDEPPCLPPIPSSNEDQRRGYQALNQPRVHFTYVLMNLRSCAEPRRAQGIVLPGLISIPRRIQTM